MGVHSFLHRWTDNNDIARGQVEVAELLPLAIKASIALTVVSFGTRVALAEPVA